MNVRSLLGIFRPGGPDRARPRARNYATELTTRRTGKKRENERRTASKRERERVARARTGKERRDRLKPRENMRERRT